MTFTRRPAAGALDSSPEEPLTKAAIALLGEERAKAVAKTIWSYNIEARKPVAA